LRALLKRVIIDSYHQMSVKHLTRYLSEFEFTLNHRETQDIFLLVCCALVIASAPQYAQPD